MGRYAMYFAGRTHPCMLKVFKREGKKSIKDYRNRLNTLSVYCSVAVHISLQQIYEVGIVRTHMLHATIFLTSKLGVETVVPGTRFT